MAKVRYMIEYLADPKKSAAGEIEYLPCGVWAVSDSQFEIGILKEKFPERAEEIHWFINYLVERDIRPHQDPEFLEYWRDSRSAYKGMFSEIAETDEFTSAVNCVNAMLERLRGL